MDRYFVTDILSEIHNSTHRQFDGHQIYDMGFEIPQAFPIIWRQPSGSISESKKLRMAIQAKFKQKVNSLSDRNCVIKFMPDFSFRHCRKQNYVNRIQSHC